MGNPALKLADFIETRQEEILDMLVSQMPFRDSEAAPHLLEAWFASEVKRLRGETTHTAEWAVMAVETERKRGATIGDIIDLVYIGGRSMLEYCVGQVAGVSDVELYQLAFEAKDHCVQQIANLFEKIERKAAAARARRERAFITGANNPVVVLNEAGRIELANDRFAKLVGITESGLEGTDFSTLCAPKNAARVRSAIRQKTTSTPRNIKVLLTLPSEEKYRATTATVLPLFDELGMRNGAVLHFEPDGSVFKGIDNHQTELFGTLARSLGIGMVVFDHSWKVVYRNDGDNAALSKLKIVDSCCSKYADKQGRCGACLESGLFDETSQTHADTASVADKHIKLACVPIRGRDGTVTHVVKAAMDNTVQKDLENQLLQLQRSSLVSRLAISVAHQLRNPLAVVVGYSEMLNRGVTSEQAPQALEKLLDNGLRCKGIVEGLLQFGLELPGDRETVYLSDILEDQVIPMYPASQMERIDWDLSEDLPPVECAPRQMAQVFANIIDNAMWAARDKLTVKTCVAEHPEAAEDSRAVSVSVCDDGPGIDPQIGVRVFEPFFTTRGGEGNVGLGLTLAKAIVQEHGGRLFFEETCSGGTCFTVQLPVAAGRTAHKPVETRRLTPVGDGQRILVVDDEEDLLQMLMSALELSGYRVSVAGSATKALDLLREHKYDLAVLDILLPGDMTGKELYQVISASYPELADRTLFITADTMSVDTWSFVQETPIPVLEKPFLVTEFIKRLNQMMSNTTRQ